MGNSISNVFSSNGGSLKTRSSVEDVLARLVILSEVKATTHYQRVVSAAIDSELLPIETVLRRLHVAHSGVQPNTQAIRAVLDDLLGSYCKLEILESLTALFYKTLSNLVSSVSNKDSSEVMSYAVTIGKNGGIGRVDCYMFFYKFRSPDLDMILDNCLVTSLIVSRCDPASLRVKDMPFLAEAAHSVPLSGESQEETDARVQRIKMMLLYEMQQPFRKIAGDMAHVRDAFLNLSNSTSSYDPRPASRGTLIAGEPSERFHLPSVASSSANVGGAGMETPSGIATL